MTHAHHPTTTRLSLARLCGALVIALVASAAALIVAPSDAQADLYTYKRKDGSLVVTTTPRSGMQLISHIRDGGGGGDSGGSGTRRPRKKISAKHQRARSIAEQKRASSRHNAVPRSNREQAFDAIIREASATYNIPFAFIKGVIKTESNFNPTVISPVGAMGLMQLMPATASYLGVKDPFDPRQNIFGGTKLLRILTNRYNGDINLLLSAYNAGEGAVDRYDGIPYAQTREYVRRVYSHYKHYQSEARTGPTSDALATTGTPQPALPPAATPPVAPTPYPPSTSSPPNTIAPAAGTSPLIDPLAGP